MCYLTLCATLGHHIARAALAFAALRGQASLKLDIVKTHARHGML
jgi:hypothetical protein